MHFCYTRLPTVTLSKQEISASASAVYFFSLTGAVDVQQVFLFYLERLSVLIYSRTALSELHVQYKEGAEICLWPRV